jgi:protein TonB
MKYAILLSLLIECTFSFSQNTRSKSRSSAPQVVDQIPEYPGGNEAMSKFIKDNIQYPENEKGKKIQGQVVLSFMVRTDGTITNIGIRQGIDKALDDEAIRVVKLMPNFNRGSENAELILSIMFGLNGISVGPGKIADDVASIYSKARSYISDQNYDVAKNYLERAADQHYPPALTQLGLLYIQGKRSFCRLQHCSEIYF